MRKIILALSIAATACSFAAAQNADDFKRAEFFAGYSNGQVDTGLDSGNSAIDFFRDRDNFNGFNVSGVYNLTRYFGIKGDVSGTYNSKRFTGTADAGGTPFTVSVRNSSSLYNFLGGVQVKDNAKSGRLKPFGHAMIGAAHARTKVSDYTCTPSTVCAAVTIPDSTFSDTGLAGAFGGGLDIRLNNKIQIRAFQADYNPVRSNGAFQHNFRFGAGIVF